MKCQETSVFLGTSGTTHVAIQLSNAVPVYCATIGLEVVGDFDGDSVAPLGVDGRTFNLDISGYKSSVWDSKSISGRKHTNDIAWKKR